MLKRFAAFILIFVLLSFFSVQAQESHFRLGMFLGGYVPSGDVSSSTKKLDLSVGGEFGVEFSYFFNRYLGVGVYLEGISTSSETDKGYDISVGGYFEDKVDVSTTIFGVLISFNAPLGSRASFVGGAKFGIASTEIEAEEKTTYTLTLKDDETAIAFSLEGGLRYKVGNMDIGGSIKYTHIPKIDSTLEGEDTLYFYYLDYEAELSGLSVLLNVGYNF
jgi:hypothetical protein